MDYVLKALEVLSELLFDSQGLDPITASITPGRGALAQAR
jgi:hypothetical protein